MIRFYDTCSLMILQEKIFEDKDPFILSNITLKELEQIKTSGTRDPETKWMARNVIRLLSDNSSAFDIEIYKGHFDEELITFDLPKTDDSKIILCAREAFIKRDCLETGVFITQDLACRKLAESVGLKTEYVKPNSDGVYTGYVTISMKEEELARFYGISLPSNINEYNLLLNQYLLIEYEGQITDKYKWTSTGYEKVEYHPIESVMFGKLKPYNNDMYQMLAIDSLVSNQITVLRGPAGSGKSYLAVSYLMSLLERGKIDRIVILANTVAVRGAAKLGYYPGSRLEKLLDSQIGNFLVTKFGSITEVEKMTDEGTLMILPCSDIRGLDLSGMRAGVYVTESQNTTIDMMKLMLQRTGEDSIVILDGDTESQVDMSEYGGSNNGLRRVSEVFRGQDFYGETTLVNIYRSRIAAMAENM